MTNDPKRHMVWVKWPTLNFGAPSAISRMADARIAKFCMQVECINY